VVLVLHKWREGEGKDEGSSREIRLGLFYCFACPLYASTTMSINQIHY
jgi:hypothetical protein